MRAMNAGDFLHSITPGLSSAGQNARSTKHPALNYAAQLSRFRPAYYFPLPARLKQGNFLTGVFNLRCLVVSKARLNAALRWQCSLRPFGSNQTFATKSLSFNHVEER